MTKAYRGMGLANKLVEKLFQQAKKHQFKSIYIGTLDSFHWAHRFYQKHGFQQIPRKALPANFEADPLDSVFWKANIENID